MSIYHLYSNTHTKLRGGPESFMILLRFQRAHRESFGRTADLADLGNSPWPYSSQS